MKCVAAKHNGMQMVQSRSHLAIGYNANGVNNSRDWDDDHWVKHVDGKRVI